MEGSYYIIKIPSLLIQPRNTEDTSLQQTSHLRNAAVPVPSRGVLSDTGLKLVHGGRVFRERRSPWNEGEGGSRAFQEREKTTLPAKELRPAPQFCNVLVLLVLKRLLAIVLRQRPVSCSEFKGFQEQENRTARSLIYHGHLRIRLAERTSSWNCSLDCYVE